MNTYDPFARYYDADFRGYTEDVPFFREMARRASGPILELMCGTGRVLLPLAEDGHPITGVDISPAMLAIARQHLDEADLSASLIEGDVLSVDLPPQTYGMAFVAVNSFMHLETVREQLAALDTARRALVRRGTLVIDLFNPDPIEIAREDNRIVLDRSYELDGNHVQKFVAIDSDAASQTSHVTYLYDETDPAGLVSRRTMRFVMRWFYRYEIEHLLARAGFSLRAVYGSYDLDEYVTGSPRLIVVASPGK
ncbi:class I SAM-dependent methyltransferase [Chloroflexales bacterium ZM16-3]|nr:class I SAM-dependent methyltransferase [Chloroflexales bacterium ZM16-3]